MLPRFLHNGEPSETLSIEDRAIHYGDGLFETVPIVDGEAVFWSSHLARLEEGCRRLAIPYPGTELLTDEMRQLVAEAQKGTVKVIVSRGIGGRGYGSPERITTSRILGLYPVGDYPARYWSDGVSLTLCQTRLGCSPSLAGLKHLNRLENVLARNEWRDGSYFEGLMSDTGGNLIEGTMSNLFLVNDGGLLTPDLTQCGVAGIVRQRVLDSAETLGIETRITTLDQSHLEQADECFITNSIIGILPVHSIKSYRYVIGGVTRQLQSLINPLVGRGVGDA